MKIKIIICMIIVIIICSIFVILKLTNQNSKSSKQLELIYKINAGIPFKWECVIEDESVVQLVKSYVIKDENKGAIVGAPVHTKYVFKGLKQGQTTITFKYLNFTNGEIDKEEIHTVKVDKEGNISLIETTNHKTS